MRVSKVSAWFLACAISLAGTAGPWAAPARAQTDTGAEAAGEAETGNPDNELCLACHGEEGFAVTAADGETRQLHITPDRFGKSVHGKRRCVECHKDIIEIPHRENKDRKSATGAYGTPLKERTRRRNSNDWARSRNRSRAT
jgi:hypothetical protein